VARSFKTSISIDDAGSAASEALRTRVTGDSQSRLLIDAGGKLTWGSGSATGDATLYRSAANALKTDDTLEAALGLITATSSGAPSSSLSDGALAVDTTNNAFYFRSGSTWRQVSGGGSSSITTSDTAPSSPSDGDLWYETDTGRTLVYYADGSSSQWVEIGVASASGVSGAAGKIQFSESNSFASDTLLHWDNTNNRLGVGTASPGYPLDVSGTSRFTGAITASGGVVGNVTGNASGTALTVTQAAQSAITSVGTLSSATITGDLIVDTSTLKVDSSNNRVGIGTASPDKLLHVSHGDSGITPASSQHAIFESDGNMAVVIGSGTTSEGFLRFGDSGNTAVGGFKYDHDGDELSIRVGGSDFVYFKDSKVGIGTTSPAVPLDVTGSIRTSGQLIVQGTNASAIAITQTDTLGGYITFNDTNGTTRIGYIGFPSTDDIYIKNETAGGHVYLSTNNTTRMIINSSGNVGIGTTSPVCALSVTSGATNSSAHFGRYDDEGLFLHSDAGSGNYNWRVTTQTVVDQGFEIAPSTAVGGQTWATPVFVIKVDGKVGIGTTSPVSALEIASDEDLTTFISNSRGALTISNTDYNSGDYQSIDFRYNTSSGPNARVAAKHTGSGSYLSFGTSNNYGNGVTNEAMVIDYLGRVGIGKAAMSYGNLTVSDGSSGANAHSYTAMIIESNTYCALSILTPNDRVGYIMFADPQGTATSAISYDHNNNSFHISTNSITRMTINSSGAMSKTSGTFDIPHPTKGGDWRLRHSFIEGPKADLIYRGTVTLSGGTATIDLDTEADMTDGTWEVLCQDPWSMVASSGNAVEWSLSGKTLTITSDTADAVCSWMVIGERQDDHMVIDNDWADDEGHLITEYEGVDNHTPPYEPGAEEEAA